MGVSREDLRRAGAALLASAAVTTLVFLTRPTLFEGVDFVRLHLINSQYAARRVAQGELPLWNPYVGLGRPFLADIETAFFYPPNAIHLVLDPVPALALLAVLHGALGLLAMRSFCRHLGATDGAAWVGGVAWLASAPFVEELLAGRSHYAWGIAYLPLAFLAARSVQDEPSVRSLARLALVLCLQLLSGHPHIAWITWFGLAWFVLGRTRLGPGAFGVATTLRSLAILALAIAWAFALGAVQLLPFAELAAHGNRSRSSLEFAASGAMGAAEWVSLVLVPAFSEQYLLYIGMVALLAGVCGLLAIDDPDRRGLLAVAVAAAALAAGQATPVFRWFYWLVPGVSTFRNPSRAGFLVCFALVAAAAAHVSSPEASRRRWILPAATLLALAATLVAHGATLEGPGRHFGWSLGLIAGSAGALAWWRRGTVQSRPPAAGVLLVLLIVVDLGTAIAAHKGTISWPEELRAEPVVVRALADAGLFDRGGVPPRISVPYWIVRDNAGALYGYSTFTGYVSLTLGRVWAYLHDVLGIPRPDIENTYPSKEIYARGPFPYTTMNLRLGFDPRTNKLVVRQAPDPRAYLVSRARVVRDWPEALRLMVAGHDPHREALVEEPLAFSAPGDETRPVKASITSFTPEVVVVDVETDAPAILVLAEAWFPGWQATVNGKPAPCVPANVWMRAVPVPAGRSEVRLTFRSTYLFAGAGISLVSLLALGVALRSRVRSFAPGA